MQHLWAPNFLIAACINVRSFFDINHWTNNNNYYKCWAFFPFVTRTWEQRTWNENRSTWSARLSELVSLHFLLIKIDVILFNLSQQCKAKFDEFSLFSKFLPKYLVNGRTLINKNLIDISHGHRDKSINVQDSILMCC